jgi:subtilase family serine protease
MSRGLDVFRYLGPSPSLPDLTVSSTGISFSPKKPKSGQSVTISARVRNAGGAAAGPVVVRFADNGSVIGEQVISSIAAGGTATASVTWNTGGSKGVREIVVTVDPNDVIDEQVEANNRASRTLEVK